MQLLLLVMAPNRLSAFNEGMLIEIGLEGLVRRGFSFGVCVAADRKLREVFVGRPATGICPEGFLMRY
jgi:hypothetical protein